MTHQSEHPNDHPATAAASTDHRSHNHFLMASLLDPDLPAEVRSRAEAQVASCRACAELLGDLRAIAAATAALPVPPRRRDFRLTAEDAARLRPRGLRRLVAAFGSPRLAALRPLGTALATLGLAGLLLTATPVGVGLLGPSTASGERGVLAPASGPGAGDRSLSGPDETGAPGLETVEPKGEVQGRPVERTVAPVERTVAPDGGGRQMPVVPLFAGLLVVGLAVVALRLLGERTVGRRAPPG